MNTNVVDRFHAVLDTKDVTEQACQAFLEENTTLLHTPFLLGHWLRFRSVISKFPLDTSLITDFAYLTGNSDFWHIVFIELEHPRAKLFRSNKKQVTPTAELTNAIAQIHTWQDFLLDNSDQVLRRLAPLRWPLEHNPVTWKFLLVIGRNDQKAGSQAMRSRLRRLGNDDILICTYDSLVSAFNNSPTFPKNVLTLRKTSFEVKYLNTNPLSMMANMSPADLHFTKAHEERIVANGLGDELKRWKAGHLGSVIIKVGEQEREQW